MQVNKPLKIRNVRKRTGGGSDQMVDDSKVSASVSPVDFVLNAHAAPLQEVEIIFTDKKRLHRFSQEEGHRISLK